MITSTISETKNHLSELLARVRQGETVIVMDRKTPVARLERVFSVGDHHSLLAAQSVWAPTEILSRPIASLSPAGASVVAAVHEERETGW